MKNIVNRNYDDNNFYAKKMTEKDINSMFNGQAECVLLSNRISGEEICSVEHQCGRSTIDPKIMSSIALGSNASTIDISNGQWV